MKKAVLVLLIVSGIISGSVIVGGFLASNEESNSSSATPDNQQTEQPPNGTQTFTQEEVSEHASTDDCWLIIEQSVYDVTDFVSQHPGGADQITSQCGKDATTAFNTQNGEGMHSSTAKSLRENFLIGNLQN